MALERGDIALDFSLPTADGEEVSLTGTLSRGRNVLLVFLRHLG